ncbi:HHIP-like protein 2 isoform X2 [Ptychodera flava]|uniref:HHIP-like protein 2 isoform X2 n=1 Tax=Ptychodera flava TaxID=63121 RepID=UPI00396A44C7
MALFYTFSLICCVIAISIIQPTLEHPQCLDYYAPFDASQDLSFCRDYSDFGCCTTARDSELESDYQQIIAQISALSVACKNYTREILCTECSPYAAHIFGAEETSFIASFPGLCTSYCLDFAQECTQVIRMLTTDGRLTSLLQDSASSFCDTVAAVDTDYCQPDVMYSEELNQEITVAVSDSHGCLCVEEFASGLRNPIAAVHAGDGSHRLFIAEQRGKVYVYFMNGTKVPEPFLDLEDTVLTSTRRGDERGLLGIAFHPKYKDNGRFFIFYSVLSDGTQLSRISEMRVLSTDANKADPDYERILLEEDEPRANHNGGELMFGDDGYLYFTLGDGGGKADAHGEIGNGQNLQTLHGSISRIDVDSEDNDLPYGIPPNNPFVHVPDARNETYAYGTRNTWRCSVDRGDPETGEGKGRIFCGDVGQSLYEEINMIISGGNYGWRGKEGYTCFDQDMCNSAVLGDDVLPIHAYDHSVGKCVIGGYVYRGCQSPNLQGLYIFGDFYNGKLFKLTENPETGAWESERLCMGDDSICNSGLTGIYPTKILSFGEDESGELYILSTNRERNNNNGGKVMKIVDPARRGDPEKCGKRFDDHDLMVSTGKVTPTHSVTTTSLATTTEMSQTTAPETSQIQSTQNIQTTAAKVTPTDKQTLKTTKEVKVTTAELSQTVASGPSRVTTTLSSPVTLASLIKTAEESVSTSAEKSPSKSTEILQTTATEKSEVTTPKKSTVITMTTTSLATTTEMSQTTAPETSQIQSTQNLQITAAKVTPTDKQTLETTNEVQVTTAELLQTIASGPSRVTTTLPSSVTLASLIKTAEESVSTSAEKSPSKSTETLQTTATEKSEVTTPKKSTTTMELNHVSTQKPKIKTTNMPQTTAVSEKHTRSFTTEEERSTKTPQLRHTWFSNSEPSQPNVTEVQTTGKPNISETDIAPDSTNDVRDTTNPGAFRVSGTTSTSVSLMTVSTCITVTLYVIMNWLRGLSFP